MSRSSRRMPSTMHKITTSKYAWCRFKRISSLPLVAQSFQKRRPLRRIRSSKTSRWNRWSRWSKIQVWWIWTRWRQRVRWRWWWLLLLSNAARRTSFSRTPVSKRINFYTQSISSSWSAILNSLKLLRKPKWRLCNLPSKPRAAWVEWEAWACSEPQTF